MAPIDPLQLLNALSPLLSPEGGIKNTDEVSRLSSLMKKFSKKLVSRCIYCNVLKATSPEILEVFLELEGWNTVNKWLQEARDSENYPFLIELLKLCQILPMSLYRLKENNTPKLIKTLTKCEQSEEVRLLSEKVVTGWMKLIKGENKEVIKPVQEKPLKKKKKKEALEPVKENRERDRKKEEVKKEEVKKDKTKDKNQKHEIRNHKISESPKHKRENNSEDLKTAVEPISKKPRTERPKTVKTFQTKFRSTGLEEAPALTKPVNKKKDVKVDKTALLNVRQAVQRVTPTVHSERRIKPSTLVNNDELPATNSGPGIKLIPAKPVHVIHEDGGFMDALTSAPPVAPAARRKRKLSAGKTTTSPTSTTTSPTTTAPKFQFYKDTLDMSNEEDKTEEIAEKEREGTPEKGEETDESKKAKEGTEETHEKIPDSAASPPKSDADKDSNENSSEEKGDNTPPNNSDDTGSNSPQSSVKSDKPAPILIIASRKSKKSVRWAEESKLKQVFYFDLDETERVNVNNVSNFGDMKTLEMKRERQAVETARRLMGDRVEESIPWTMPVAIDLPPPLVQPGCNSQEKETQRIKQQKTLQEIYFSKEMIPDSPYEPEQEAVAPCEPKVIPLEDESNPSAVMDHSQAEIQSPKSTSLPPILSNLVMSISSKSQPPNLQEPQQKQQQIPPHEEMPANNIDQPMHFEPPPQMASGPRGRQSRMNMMGPGPGGPRGPGFDFPMPQQPGPGMDMHMDWNMMPDNPEFFPPGPMGMGPPHPHGPMGMPMPPQMMEPSHPPPHGMRGGRDGRGPRRGSKGRNVPHVLCKFFSSGGCKWGPSCSFLHPGINGPHL